MNRRKDEMYVNQEGDEFPARFDGAPRVPCGDRLYSLLLL